MTAPVPIVSFDAFYRSENGRMLRYFRRKVGRDAARDLVQEVFTRLLRSGALERAENPQAYLFRAAHNLLIEGARRRTREQGVFCPFDEGRDTAVEPEQEWRIEAMELRRIYRRTLRAMPHRTRRVFLMHRLRGLSYREIAEQLGIGDKGVEYHMMRALARCRRAVAARA